MSPPINARPAGFVSRMISFILDLVIISLTTAMMISLTTLITNFFQVDILLRRLLESSLGLTNLMILFISLFSFVFMCGYFLVFWTVIGSTPGKLFMGLRIVRQDNRQITLGRAILRFIGYWISALPLFIGFLWVLIDRRRQGWHDKLADTKVIYYWEQFRKN